MNEDLEILDSTENPEEVNIPEMDEGKLLLTIWAQPRNTLLYIIYRNPDKLVLPLLVIGGVASGMNRIIDNSNNSFGQSVYVNIFIAAVMGAIFGPLLNMLFANILAWFGRKIGGQGKYQGVLASIAWSQVPTIASLILLIFALGYVGLEGIMGGRIISSSESIALVMVGSFQFVLGIWSIVILVTGLSVAHKFGIGKALLNLFLPILAILIPIAAIAFILGDLFNN